MSINAEDWESVFRAGRDMMVLIDADTYHVVQVTDALLKVHSIDQDFAVGKPLFEVFPPLPGSSPDSSFESFVKVKSTKSTDIQNRVRFDVRRPDGSYEQHYWISSHYPVFDRESGEVKYILIYADDVTALVNLDNLAASLGRVGDSLRSAVDVILDVKLRSIRDNG